ncbi:hypothetical protein AC482_06165 [miscellaneous Crenarchaeota group-15 archaeon DG-45]|uniref:Uncharacterized protein n=1 Tax=miscellaneous Crenarchaeota group-15 archaeon DG-45 TaxID=1685127 RepID=A0A0M0BMK2_9ARCH|nr:MAG: hypothetical protein AC482_06165 [miscellaneous Crenarchaeota group-15 archaeon DG-45]
MASEATTYFYTLLALGVIGLMITASFEAHAMDLRTASGKRELKGLLEAIASEGAELIALAEATDASSRVCLRLPGTLGNIRWWARLASDSTGAWVEGGLGDPWEGRPELRVELPWNVSVSGTYEGGVGTLSLSCSRQGSDIMLILGKWEAG